MTTKKTTTKKKVAPTIWETLSKINVNEHSEKKGRFTYLSWSWAWGILMEHYPDATFNNHLNQDGYPCFFDRNGYAMVRVTLCIGDKCHTEDFMITDNKNNAIKNPDSSEVNTALKRCLVKSMAYFGLGHYIYAGEDLPPQESVPFDRDEAIKAIKAHQDVRDSFEEDDGKWTESILMHFDKTKLTDLTDDQLQQVITKISKMEKKNNG
tara:strand:+ start:504 stop:1130 length:627 start_codon:yes stop_codon:yes gene_type:complete